MIETLLITSSAFSDHFVGPIGSSFWKAQPDELSKAKEWMGILIANVLDFVKKLCIHAGIVDD